MRLEFYAKYNWMKIQFDARVARNNSIEPDEHLNIYVYIYVYIFFRIKIIKPDGIYVHKHFSVLVIYILFFQLYTPFSIHLEALYIIRYYLDDL